MVFFILRLTLWGACFALLVVSFLVGEEFTKKLPNTKNNTAHGGDLHRKRLFQYFWRRTTAIGFGMIIPGVMLVVILLYPEFFVGDTNKGYLSCANATNCNYQILSTLFISDQVLMSMPLDIGRLLNVGFETHYVVQETMFSQILVHAYRFGINIYAVAAIFYLGRVIVDRLLIRVPIGKREDDQRNKYINLSGLSRGYIEDEPLEKLSTIRPLISLLST